MKIERLSENQLRFTVWSNDLPEGGITIAELAGDSEKTEELVLKLIDLDDINNYMDYKINKYC